MYLIISNKTAAFFLLIFGETGFFEFHYLSGEEV